MRAAFQIEIQRAFGVLENAYSKPEDREKKAMVLEIAETIKECLSQMSE